jgi:hypothetical protein
MASRAGRSLQVLEGDETVIGADASGPPLKKIKVSNGIINGNNKLLTRSAGTFLQ